MQKIYEFKEGLITAIKVRKQLDKNHALASNG